jgi:hypothetical protein
MSERTRACATLRLPTDRPLTTEQLKRAYRKAAIRWHPHRTGGDAVRYAEIQQARMLLEGALNVPEPVPAPAAPAPASPPTPTQPPPPLAGVGGPARPDPGELPEQYSVRQHNGDWKLCLELSVPLRTLVEGGRIGFVHTDGKRYGVSLGAGSWGGWAELPGLGLRPGTDALVVTVQPAFPRSVPADAQKLISRGLALCPADHSLMLHELMPELTR